MKARRVAVGWQLFALGAVVLAAVLGFASASQASSALRPGVDIGSVPNVDLPDPWLVASGGHYFMFLSTSFGDPRTNIPVFEGTPGHWRRVGDALPGLPDWAVPISRGGQTWAPEVFHVGNRWVMYSSPSLADRRYFAPLQIVGPETTHCILVAASAFPQGPYQPVGSNPLVCQTTLGGDIDAQLFVDRSGPEGPAHPNYLIWKSDNNELWKTYGQRLSGPPTIWGSPLSNDGLRLTGTPVQIFTPDRSWEQPIVEAPQMIHAPNGSDWLFFSAGLGYFQDHYGIGATQCTGPLGGCLDVEDGPLISSNGQGSGPGEETVYVASNNQSWILYSPWHTGLPDVHRPVYAARIGWSSLGPFIVDPPKFPRPLREARQKLCPAPWWRCT